MMNKMTWMHIKDLRSEVDSILNIIPVQVVLLKLHINVTVQFKKHVCVCVCMRVCVHWSQLIWMVFSNNKITSRKWYTWEEGYEPSNSKIRTQKS